MLLTAEKFRRWQRYFCPVCGHIEWLAEGEELPQDYRCPLCGVGRSTMLLVDDPRLAKHSIEFKELVPGFWQTKKKPSLPDDYNHYSYILAHPEGLILYDAPSIITQAAIDSIYKLGKPRLLVLSHSDFIGLANDWAEILSIPLWIGDKEVPLLGNKVFPTERVNDSSKVAKNLELIYVDGHSPSSLVLYWETINQDKILCAGDVLTVWHHKKEAKTQVAIFQSPPVRESVKDLLLRPISLLATCTGTLKNISNQLKELCLLEENCARPWQGERGGIWI